MLGSLSKVTKKAEEAGIGDRIAMIFCLAGSQLFSDGNPGGAKVS